MTKKDLILVVGVDDRGTPVIKHMSKAVGGELKRLDQQARKTGKGMKKLKDDVEKSATGFSKLKGILKSTMLQMAMGMGVMMGVQGAMRLLKNVVSDFIKTGRAFEKGWANVTTMLSISESETVKLKNKLIGLSPTLGSVTKMAEGMYQVLSASIEPAKAIEFLGTAAKAAVAGVTDSLTAVDALTTVINAYGFAAEDATKISDIMFQTVKRGKLTFGELSGALGTVVPTAAQLGIRFEEIAAGMATLTRQGINVNTVTMQLRQVMMSVLKPTSEAKTLAKELGIEFTASALKAKGLSKFLEEITEKTGGNVTIMGEFFSNIRALSAVFGLAGKSAAEFAYDISLMESSVGSTDVAFKKQMKTLDFWIRTASNALEDMKVAFYEGMVDPIRAMISDQDDLDKVFESLTESASMAGKSVGALSKIMGLFKPVLDDMLNKVANIDIEWAKFVNFISMGYIPALDNLAQKKANLIIESDRLSKSGKGLESNMKGIWGELSRGAILWKNTVDAYINSGMAVDEYLDKLHKLWRGQAQFQKQEAATLAMDALKLVSKQELSRELETLQSNILAVTKVDGAYSKQLETHIKKAIVLADITGKSLDPAVRKLAIDLKLLDDTTIQHITVMKGIVTGTDWWNKKTTDMKTVMQNVQPALLGHALAWGKVNLKLRERNKLLMEKYAITMPPPMDQPWLTALDKMALAIQTVGQYTAMVTGQMDAMFNQLYQNQMQRIDNEYQARKQAIDEGMASDQEKYYQIEALDREMEKKRLQAQRKHAKAAKMTSLTGAIVNTAEAITASLKAGGLLGIALAAIVGAMGAAQIALIAATPLPSFAKGGIAGLRGPEVIMVGEEGPERITPLKDERSSVIMPGVSMGTGSRSVLFEVNYYITSMDSLGVRDFVRDKAGPEMVEWIKLNRTEMLEALELE